MESALGEILGNPEMMQTIASLAQSLGGSRGPSEQTDSQDARPEEATPEPGNLGQMAALLQGAAIDPRQKALLSALTPYLSDGRIRKLKKAMQAAKMAQLASGFLGGINHV